MYFIVILDLVVLWIICAGSVSCNVGTHSNLYYISWDLLHVLSHTTKYYSNFYYKKATKNVHFRYTEITCPRSHFFLLLHAATQLDFWWRQNSTRMAILPRLRTMNSRERRWMSYKWIWQWGQHFSRNWQLSWRHTTPGLTIECCLFPTPSLVGSGWPVFPVPLVPALGFLPFLGWHADMAGEQSTTQALNEEAADPIDTPETRSPDFQNIPLLTVKDIIEPLGDAEALELRVWSNSGIKGEFDSSTANSSVFGEVLWQRPSSRRAW